MNGAAYHNSVPQPFRIQKRLALNQCFRAIQRCWPDVSTLVYVTFGGQDLYDSIDLLSVFDLTRTEMTILSFEESPQIAREAKSCPVFKALAKIPSIKLKIIRATFPAGIEFIRPFRDTSRFIYFLDYTGTFGHADSRALDALLQEELIRAGDFVMITSCLAPRVVRQPKFMERYRTSFQLLFQQSKIDASFKIRNHVDLFVGLSLSDFERTSDTAGLRHQIRATLLKKYKYADSTAMGLWLYQLEAGKPTTVMRDQAFEEFPHAFSAPRRASVPSIFD